MKTSKKDAIVKNGVDNTILLNELRAAAKPLQDFLAKYYDLETIAIVDIMYASVKATRIGVRNEERFK